MVDVRLCSMPFLFRYHRILLTSRFVDRFNKPNLILCRMVGWRKIRQVQRKKKKQATTNPALWSWIRLAPRQLQPVLGFHLLVRSWR